MTENTRSFNFKKWLLLILLVAILGCFFYFRLYTYLTFESLQDHRQILLNWTEQHLILALLCFSAVYIVAVAASIPGAVLLTLSGGFLFGPILGTIAVVISATIGAFVIFLAVNLALRDWFARKAAKWTHTMEEGFHKNAFTYLFIIRLIPIFPFWLVNIVPALLGMKKRSYILATFLGIIPGSFIYVSIGNGLGYIFDSGETPNLGIIFEPQVLLPLVALALLSTLPMIYKWIKAKRNETQM